MYEKLGRFSVSMAEISYYQSISKIRVKKEDPDSEVYSGLD